MIKACQHLSGSDVLLGKMINNLGYRLRLDVTMSQFAVRSTSPSEDLSTICVIAANG